MNLKKNRSDRVYENINAANIVLTKQEIDKQLDNMEFQVFGGH